ncbi:serine hydrolase [Bradyrhizobium sp. SEMIA]|uniref:serine hydrolase n=1 Tax=Bradyrhizobium sp. SEMIA TaxID=2597515 RepID=UPI0022408241|nr:serine hydrolase [Bradyrhizobium sp. SEMIA]
MKAPIPSPRAVSQMTPSQVSSPLGTHSVLYRLADLKAVAQMLLFREVLLIQAEFLRHDWKIAANLLRVAPLIPKGRAACFAKDYARMWSYNNTALYPLGRILELLQGYPYGDVLDEALLAPLGMDGVCFFARDLRHRNCAVGHAGRGEETLIARPWPQPRCVDPSGGVVTSAAHGGPTDWFGRDAHRARRACAADRNHAARCAWRDQLTASRPAGRAPFRSCQLSCNK